MHQFHGTILYLILLFLNHLQNCFDLPDLETQEVIRACENEEFTDIKINQFLAIFAKIRIKWILCFGVVIHGDERHYKRK